MLGVMGEVLIAYNGMAMGTMVARVRAERARVWVMVWVRSTNSEPVP